MPIFRVSGFEKGSARNAPWYIHAKSRSAAQAHAAHGGLVDAELDEIELSAVPPDASLIRADEGPADKPARRPSLFWTIFFAVVLANLATAAIFKLIASM